MTTHELAKKAFAITFSVVICLVVIRVNIIMLASLITFLIKNETLQLFLGAIGLLFSIVCGVFCYKKTHAYLSKLMESIT